jgi:uncharacterized protein (DUF983 family)
MSSPQIGLFQPRCPKCGKKIYLKYSPYREYVFRKPPSYCPNCGEELSVEKKKDLVEHEELVFGIFCILAVIFLIIIGVIFGAQI